MRKLSWLIAIIAFIYFSPRMCSDYDSDYFPYNMIGLNTWVYDSESDRGYRAGSVKATYSERERALSDCAAQARNYANQKHFERWRYVCCTVTKAETCMTKVR
jgi:hypothetical protein